MRQDRAPAFVGLFSGKRSQTMQGTPTRFYYSPDGNEIAGPESFDDLLSWYKSGKTPKITQICREGEQAWLPLSVFTENPPPIPSKNEAWFYSRSGKRLGPFNGAQIRNLITEGSLGPNSLVWCEGMADWISARQSALRPLFGAVIDPPPLIAENVNNNGIVWTIAFAPIIVVFLSGWVASITGYSNGFILDRNSTKYRPVHC